MAILGTGICRRLAALTLSGVVATTALVAVAPSPAQAAPPCLPTSDWVLLYANQDTWVYEAYEFHFLQANSTFNVSDTRIAWNTLDTPASTTFTSSQSRTFTLGVSGSMAIKLGPWLTVNLGGSVTTSWTTSIGVSITATVPPHSTVRGEYGVKAWNVWLAVTTYRMERPAFGGPPGPIWCYSLGTHTPVINVPTVEEGWRISLA